MGAQVIHETRIIFPVGRGTSSTGRATVNEPQDVRALQELLNNVDAGSGGPDAPLTVNGVMDDATFRAIGKFQQRQFGWQDGVVDPRQKTLRKLNEIAGTPMTPLKVSLIPAPRLVSQDSEFHCWAAALESWLELSPPRDALPQDEPVDEFQEVEDPDTEAMTNQGWSAVSVRFNMGGTLFSLQGTFLHPNEINGEFIADKLGSNGYLLFIYNLVPSGPSHVNIVYGVSEQGNQTFVQVMDPFTRGNGGMQTRPLTFYTRRSGVGLMWARKAGE
jgi:Putative peptidoglycan binding domain